MPVAALVTSHDASPQEAGVTNVAVAGHGGLTWTGAIHGTVPEADIMVATGFLLYMPSTRFSMHMVDASIIGVHLRRAQEALYRGIKGPISHFVHQLALNWVVEGLKELPRMVGELHKWVVCQSFHLAAVPLEEPDCFKMSLRVFQSPKSKPNSTNRNQRKARAVEMQIIELFHMPKRPTWPSCTTQDAYHASRAG